MRFKDESKAKPYVDDDLFLLALEHSPPWLQTYLWLKLATGLRQKDMLQLRPAVHRPRGRSFTRCSRG